MSQNLCSEIIDSCCDLLSNFHVDSVIQTYGIERAAMEKVGNQNIYHYVMKRNSTAAELEQFKRELEDMINKAEVEK